MKKKGFTLIELLVVIAIIAMLLAILMPALGKVKRIAMRLVCGTNLRGMGTAVNVYAFDYRDEYPIQGGPGINTWSTTGAMGGWANPSKDWSGDDAVTVSSSLFMLVREADVGVKSFVCQASNQQPFVNMTPSDVVELWDFGSAGHASFGDYGARKCQSYSYQVPYRTNAGHHPADGTSNPGNAVMADRNPWFDPAISRSVAPTGEDFLETVWTIVFDSSNKWAIQVGNAEPHDREGQNVLFNDGHVDFAKRPDVGTRYDNIYTTRGAGALDADRRVGNPPKGVGITNVRNSEDTVLVNDSWWNWP
ncbi:MAG: type II secretion system protein [Planctomycetes bacterium]|nr:type II secretion system protein [Planctomycetota bacterium]